MKPNEVVDEGIMQSLGNALARTGVMGKAAQGSAMLARQNQLAAQIGSSEFNRKLQAGLAQAIATKRVNVTSTTVVPEALDSYKNFSRLLESLILSEAPPPVPGTSTGMSISDYVVLFVKNQIKLEKLPEPSPGSDDEARLKALADDFQAEYISKKQYPKLKGDLLFQFLQDWEGTNVKLNPYDSIGNVSSDKSGTGSNTISIQNMARLANNAQYPVVNTAGTVNPPSDRYTSLIKLAVNLLTSLGAIDKQIYPDIIRRFNSSKSATPTKLIDKAAVIDSLTRAPIDGSDKYAKLKAIAKDLLWQIHWSADHSVRATPGDGDRIIANIDQAYKRKYP